MYFSILYFSKPNVHILYIQACQNYTERYKRPKFICIKVMSSPAGNVKSRRPAILKHHHFIKTLVYIHLSEYQTRRHRYLVAVSYFTNIEVQNVNNAFVLITDLTSSLTG